MPECDFCHKQKDNITVCNDIDDIPTDKLICDDCMDTLPERFIKNERKRIIKIIESTPIPSRQGTGKAIKEIINLINLEL